MTQSFPYYISSESFHCFSDSAKFLNSYDGATQAKAKSRRG